nr:unnamed protein product [Digitaria exilis]
MGRRRPPGLTPGDDSTADRITALPVELRARIASLLHYWQVVQLSVLSQAWRHIHHHTPVVKINLYDFYLGEPDPVLGRSRRERGARCWRNWTSPAPGSSMLVSTSAFRSSDGRCQVPPFGEITIDAPELLELDVNCGAPGSTADYKSFTLRAPRLHFLFWCNQFAERVAIDVGRPGSVKVGAIVLMTVYTRELKDYQEQMMRMLEGLLPDVPPESIADVSK